MNTHFDVLIIGAGLSGIGTACHLAEVFPQKRLAILERRERIGGTWDLFRYPGIRSDSDMFSFGFKFRPWNAFKVLADGPAIRDYIRETAREYGVEEKIRFGLRTTQASWCSQKRQWTVTALHETSGETQTYTCNFLIGCTGYYNHDAGFLPQFPGVEQFKGQCIHPQQWPENLNYAGKNVVVIGSGATAVTLVPAMAGTAGHVTMLQRSPSYIYSLPAHDRITEVLAKILPARWAFGLARWRNILIQQVTYQACKRWPKLMRRYLLAHVRKRIGADVAMRHFTPKYMPWDQRLCAVPDADLFNAVRDGKASIETDQIDRFTESGIRLQSGKELQADIIVTATGINLQLLGGMQLSVDGQPRLPNRHVTYKGVLIENLPNLAWVFGYTNASWTLKSDIAAGYLCRLLRHMDDKGYGVAMPRDTEGCAQDSGIFDSLQAGYTGRGNDVLPRQGRKLPWRVQMRYGRDRRMLLEDAIDDGVLRFELAAAAERNLHQSAAQVA
ncbi:MAG: NAD(P)/FAD-dependent oxidoreductase [Pseudomonadota bacterium]|nr:NAD(P)/FAD-dependent oxidoreductase [Pseudomonadota bacterium]